VSIEYRFLPEEHRLTVRIEGEEPVDQLALCMQRMIKDFAVVGGRCRALVDLRPSAVTEPREEALDLAESFSAALRPLRSRVALVAGQQAVFRLGRMVEKSTEVHGDHLAVFAGEEKARQWLDRPLDATREESRRGS
jgi:hypothetical protein